MPCGTRTLDGETFEVPDDVWPAGDDEHALTGAAQVAARVVAPLRGGRATFVVAADDGAS